MIAWMIVELCACGTDWTMKNLIDIVTDLSEKVWFVILRIRYILMIFIWFSYTCNIEL